jgi:hypothetical protein
LTPCFPFFFATDSKILHIWIKADFSRPKKTSSAGTTFNGGKRGGCQKASRSEAFVLLCFGIYMQKKYIALLP